MPSLQELIGNLQPVSGTDGLSSGTVVSFNYTLHRHDPYPIILLLADEGAYLFGINLHYVTFPAAQMLFRMFQNIVRYQDLNNRPNIRHAFRRYKKTGILYPRTQELSDILRRMAIPRIYPEHEIRRAREDFRQQAEAVPEEGPTEPTGPPEAPTVE